MSSKRHVQEIRHKHAQENALARLLLQRKRKQVCRWGRAASLLSPLVIELLAAPVSVFVMVSLGFRDDRVAGE